MNKTQTDTINKKINTLKPKDFTKALQAFQEKITSEYATYLNSCVRCGLCAESCHYFLAYKDLKSMPAYKLNLIMKVFKKYSSFAGNHFSFWFGAKEIKHHLIQEWIDNLFGRCSLCGRCFLNCTMGINIPYLIRAARNALSSLDLVPPGLQSTITIALKTGNNMGITTDDWIETLDWLEDELEQDVEDQNVKIPLDIPNAKILYAINPREAMFFPLSILAVAKIFYAAKENWTFSSKNYDVTNYGFFIGDDKTAGKLAYPLVESMETLKCKDLILSECGHGFNSNRWEASEWLSKKQNFDVKSIIQNVAEYIKTGRIKLDSSYYQKTLTLHDPCNLVRFGGIVEEQRFILRQVTNNFVEMSPNRENNFCCGGGGGQLAMTRYADRRRKSGEVKAEQIRRTGADIVVAPCHNCVDQITELNKHYQLGVEIKTVCEIVADALILNRNTSSRPGKK
ncbi:(Fe-S)-binding protein [Acidobacteriota bacterium]